MYIFINMFVVIYLYQGNIFYSLKQTVFTSCRLFWSSSHILLSVQSRTHFRVRYTIDTYRTLRLVYRIDTRRTVNHTLQYRIPTLQTVEKSNDSNLLCSYLIGLLSTVDP